jgi:hypothetical protein
MELEIIESLYKVRQQKAALEKTEKALLAQLKPLVDPTFDANADLGLTINETVIHAGSFDLTRTSGTNRSVSADLLLERGVAPDVISFATKTTTYYQYRVKDNKQQ